MVTSRAGGLSLGLHVSMLAAVLWGIPPAAPPPIPTQPPVIMAIDLFPPAELAPKPDPPPESPPAPTAKPPVSVKPPVTAPAPAPIRPRLAKIRPTASAQETSLAGDAVMASSAPPQSPPHPPGPSQPQDSAPVAAPLSAAPAPKDSLDGYLSHVSLRIKSRLVYPRLSLARGEQGIIQIRALVDAHGMVADISVVGTGPALLCQAAEQAVRDSAPFPPPPPDLGERVALIIPVRFDLAHP